MALVEPTTKTLSSFDHTQGREELNLAEFPLFYLGQRVPKDLTTLTREIEINDSARNRKVTRRLKIVANDSSGVPTSRDMDVLHAIIAVGKHTNDLASPTIHFSRYQLCEILGWPQNGASYKRLEEAICKWLTITLFFESWWDKEEGAWRNLKGFHIFDDIEINEAVGRTSNQAALPFSSVRLGDRIFKSLHSGNVKRLNLADYFHLKLPTAKRLYGFLDKRFYHNPRLDFDLRTLACEHVGMSRDYKTSKLKTKLGPAIEELVSIGFIEPMHPDQRFSKVGHGIYQVHFVRKTSEKIGTLPLSGSKREKVANRQLIKLLTDYGMTPTTARQLVEDPDIPEERIRHQVEVLEWKINHPDQEEPRSRGGYLRKAITEDYAAPKEFETKAVREARLKKAAEYQKRRDEADALQAKREREEQASKAAKEAQELQRVQTYLNSLSPAELEACYDAAFAARPPGDVVITQAAKYRRDNSLDGTPKIMFDIIVKDHVLKQLEEQTLV